MGHVYRAAVRPDQEKLVTRTGYLNRERTAAQLRTPRRPQRRSLCAAQYQGAPRCRFACNDFAAAASYATL